tara:strand:- start:67 stop:294 length:228 start_codon:yes stop_codon:yes gene_type:complete
MPKIDFHYMKSINQNINKKTLFNTQHVYEKKVVDINILLNRVKLDKKNEIKKKIIFYSFTILGLSLLGILITYLK